jgi:hypothetical protein
MPAVASSGKRPFWLHQLAEYVLAGGLLATGLRGDDPLLPVVLGVALALNAACVDGPFGAFRVLSRRAHRVIDIVILAGMVVALVLPGTGSRWVIGGVALVEAFVILNSNYAKRVKRSAPVQATAGGGRSEEVGRMAGRMAGLGVQAYRKRGPRTDRHGGERP